MFNWLSVLVLLPLEIAVGYLAWLSGKAVSSLGLEGSNTETPDMLKAITGPLIDSIVDVNKDIIKEVAANSNATSGDVLMRWCETKDVLVDHISPELQAVTVNCEDQISNASLFASTCQIMIDEQGLDPSTSTTLWVGYNKTIQEMETLNIKRCDNLFAKTDLSDAAAGSILLIISLIVIMGTLYCIVKILNSMLSGSVTRVIRKSINSDFPYPFGYLTGYVAMLIGVGLTILVQSSSVFTSTLTPMVGLGIVSVERMYPMTLGSNVGTTVTSILAALSQSGDQLKDSLQIALCHLFFNVSGILLFYPIPFMRWPIGMAKSLGKTTSKHRWFAIFYLIIMFVLLPGFVFALSYAGWVYLAAVGGPILVLFLLVLLINVLQRKRPGILPVWLRDWEFLPICCHSLKPVDALIAATCRCGFCQSLQHASKDIDNDSNDNDNDLDDNETAVLRELDQVAVDRDENQVAKETRPLGNGTMQTTGSDNLAFQMDTKF